MKSSLLAKISQKNPTGNLFEMSSIVPGYMKDPPLKKEVLRLAQNKEIIRYSYGLYYLPSAKAPSAIEAVRLRYIGNQKDLYGFYSGYTFIKHLKGFSIDDGEKIEITTNKATSGKKVISFRSLELVLKKPYVHINKYNAALVALLTYIASAPMNEIEENSSLLSSYVRNNHLSAIEAMKIMDKVPGKVASKLLKSDLYRSFWKH